MINSLTFANVNNYNTYPSFQGSSAKKLIEGLQKAKSLTKVHYTFDEMVKVYNELGYDVMLRRGSHAAVNLGDYTIPLVIPHKDKYVTLADIKRLKFVIEGNFEAASRV